MSYSRRGPDDWELDYDPTSEFEDPESFNDSPASATADTASTEPEQPAVTVQLTEAGVVTSVTLAPDWQRSVDPRQLHTSVLSAANAATMQALAHQVKHATDPSAAPDAGAPADIPDTSPLNKDDVMRLLDAVSADLHHFTEQLPTRIGQTASVESSGGHVRGSAKHGQILDVWIDPTWAASARNSEIELELTEALTQLGEQSSPGELAQGPRSQAINELQALASEPQLLLRRVGLLP